MNTASSALEAPSLQALQAVPAAGDCHDAWLQALHDARHQWGEVVALPQTGPVLGAVLSAMTQRRITTTRAADVEATWWQPSRHGELMVIEVPGLTPTMPQRRSEPGDADLAPRLVVHYPGEPQARRVTVGGLSRQFWRARAAAQHVAGFDVDVVLVHRQRCCWVPSTALVSVQA